MNSVGMQALANRPRLFHKVAHGLIRDNDMDGRNDLVLVEAPHVQFVHRLDAGDLFEIVSDVVELEAGWGALEENVAATPAYRQGCDQDHEGNKHADGGVGVEPGVASSLPDNGG